METILYLIAYSILAFLIFTFTMGLYGMIRILIYAWGTNKK